VDLHAGQIQGFFDIPVDHMPGVPLLADYVRSKNLDDLIVVSPDLGGVTRARQLADRLHAPIAIIEKRRPMPGVAEVMNLIGNVEGRTAVMIDDIVDTAGSLTEGANALIKFGAKEVYACCTHGVLSDPAVARIEASTIKELVITNTIPLPPEKENAKIRVLSIAPLLGEAILRIFGELPVSRMFDE
jgi:ribose-phosphate pyrophosphokinase